ncbi:putative BEL1-like homeodomain 8 [Melia azedarach]|uniref:BEL1-like homeodomain 8 n=2 Tax=Melia azedarach TaxID=155640 RepID=A0ACC1YNX6_MELAZ|nr:putative BEL1-like homeodomain 8 [Melia azedarach]KAJ4725079.1 putative BEL1-like homeodomain 8 [Melia azedarach]
MEMGNFRPDSHVAQRSRRDKLRVQQFSTSVPHLEDFTGPNLEQSSVSPDLMQVRDVRNGSLLYDSSTLASSNEIISFSTNSNVLSDHRELGSAQHNNRPIMTGDDLFTILPHPVSSHFRVTGDFQGCGDMRSLDSQTNSEWVVNYASGSGSGSAGRESNQNAVLEGEVLSNNMKVSDVSTSRKYLRPDNYDEYQDVQSTSTNPSSEIPCQYREKFFGDMHYATPLVQNTVQDVVTLASIGTRGLEVASLLQHNARDTGHASWTDHSGNELILLPNYGNQASAFRYNHASNWSNRPAESFHQWSTESGFIGRKSDLELRSVASDAPTQVLSLSLSSNPPSKVNVGHFGEGYEPQDLHSKDDDVLNAHHQDLKDTKSGFFGTIPKPSRACKKPVQDTGGTCSYNVHRGTGPLGPFTGYATILKNSRFLKPAQELLDEFCHLTRPKLAKISHASERVSGDRVTSLASASASAEADAANNVYDREVKGKGNNSSGVSSTTFYSSNQINCEGGVGSSSCESYKPEYQEMKAKLLYLQEEVCKRYKLYQQQMQMVVSSFESVAGLSAATPYVSLAFKTISKNFRCLRGAITNQLKHVTKALGEELLSSATGTSSSKGDTNTTKLKCMDQILQKHKSCGVNVGFLEPQQHVWRPQRGLPERAVAILRAWLFEHFLHPYPTDTDKHMLATQTGLSRNQVSNWFINARVRVWKPMVEEIHMLETQGLAQSSQNLNKNERRSASEGTAGSFNSDQSLNKLAISAMSDEQLDYSGIGSSRGNEEALTAEGWSQEKRSRVESQFTTSMDRSLMGFMPYQRRGIEVGGLGPVSLTLGLRHGVESSQQRQEDQLRRQFGGQIIHDFVG